MPEISPHTGYVPCLHYFDTLGILYTQIHLLCLYTKASFDIISDLEVNGERCVLLLDGPEMMFCIWELRYCASGVVA